MKRMMLLMISVAFFLSGYCAPEKNDTLRAFTHPRFFYSEQCECSVFNFDYIYLSLYDTAAKHVEKTVIPANFDGGHEVSIIAKKGNYFKIRMEEGAPKDCEQNLEGKEFCVEKGTLGIWLYNYDQNAECYQEVPLYEAPSCNSKVAVTVGIAEGSVGVVLDIDKNWMYIEVIGKNGGKRGWLSPANQCGNPYGIGSDYSCY